MHFVTSVKPTRNCVSLCK